MPILWPAAAAEATTGHAQQRGHVQPRRRLSSSPPDADADAVGAAEAAAAADRASLEKHLRLDLALYEFAEKLFDERVAAMRRDQAAGLRCRFNYEHYHEQQGRRREERRRQRQQGFEGGGGGAEVVLAPAPAVLASVRHGDDGCALRCAVPTLSACAQAQQN